MVSNEIKLNDDITIGGQPTPGQLADLVKRGFKSVVNLREAGEEDQPISPDDEGDLVEDLELTYASLPASLEDLDAVADEFVVLMDGLPKPTFIHCKSGKRASTLAMVYIGIQEGWDGDRTIQKAEESGFLMDNPQIEEFIRSYVNAHSS